VNAWGALFVITGTLFALAVIYIQPTADRVEKESLMCMAWVFPLYIQAGGVVTAYLLSCFVRSLLIILS
jgi:hypothetical protein